MALTLEGQRASQFALCVKAAASYGLSEQHAKDVIDGQIAGIHEHWEQAADDSRLSGGERELLWGRAILNQYALENC